jgi:RNA polymerase sigma factor (sigma-70 family)
MTEPDNHEVDLAPEESHSGNQPRNSSRHFEKRGSEGPANDHELLSAYAVGNEQAFETLVGRYFAMVYAVASRQTGDSHLGEEVVQSVFLILSRKARKFSPKASVAGWLLRTTRFVCRDALKMRWRRERNERSLARMLEPQGGPTPHPTSMEVLLDEAIQTLRPDEQAGLVAHFFEGRDFRELAEMFAISEHAARKRTSRCLAKLQAFMAKRGAKLALPALSTLLLAKPAPRASTQSLDSTLHALHAAWGGDVAGAHAVFRAERVERLLRRRLGRRLILSLMSLLLLTLTGVWSLREWRTSVQIEKLGQAWGGLDQLVAEHTRFLMRTPPTAPNYQATVQAELGAISRESSRILSEVKPLLAPPNERKRLALFLTAELSYSLHLGRSQRAAVFSYTRRHLEQGASPAEAMKAVAEHTKREAMDLKALLSPAQKQVFDDVYGGDGNLLFSYLKVVALGTIGP